MENLSFFSKNLRTYLFANDISRDQMAKLLGVGAASTVGKWINENRPPPGPIMKHLEKEVGISASEFINEDLTLRILKDASYTNLLADPEDGTYANNATIKLLTRHISETMDQLKLIEQASAKVLELAKPS